MSKPRDTAKLNILSKSSGLGLSVDLNGFAIWGLLGFIKGIYRGEILLFAKFCRHFDNVLEIFKGNQKDGVVDANILFVS